MAQRWTFVFLGLLSVFGFGCSSALESFSLSNDTSNSSTISPWTHMSTIPEVTSGYSTTVYMTTTNNTESPASTTVTTANITEPSTSTAVTTANITESPSSTTTSPATEPTTAATSGCPAVNTYKIKNSNNHNHTCLMVTMEAYFQQPNHSVTNVTKTFDIDGKGSSCSALAVTFGNKNESSFLLEFTEEKNTSFYLSTVFATVNGVSGNKSVEIGKAAMKASYKCDAGFSVALSHNITMYAKSVQFQAFAIDKDRFGTVVDCKDLNPIIPIVVGSVLAGLVLVVVVAYIIGRRRSRTGYEEI